MSEQDKIRRIAEKIEYENYSEFLSGPSEDPDDDILADMRFLLQCIAELKAKLRKETS